MTGRRNDPKTPRRRLRRLRSVAILPSLFTLGNLLCGFAAIFYASRDPDVKHLFQNFSPLTIAALLIFLGMFFDALDGRVARLTRQTSALGEQLDSMADMVTFGVAPAFLIIELVDIGTPFFGAPKWDTYFDRAVLMIAGVYAACCALRLARYNVEAAHASADSHLWFKGLPSPGAAGTVASLVLLHQHLLFGASERAEAADVTTIGLVAITFLVALAMVSNLRYAHAANRYLSGRAPFHYIVTAVVVIILLSTVPQWALAAVLVSYALSAPVMWVVHAMRRGGDDAPTETEEDVEEFDEATGEDDEPPLRMRG